MLDEHQALIDGLNTCYSAFNAFPVAKKAFLLDESCLTLAFRPLSSWSLFFWPELSSDGMKPLRICRLSNSWQHQRGLTKQSDRRHHAAYSSATGRSCRPILIMLCQKNWGLGGNAVPNRVVAEPRIQTSQSSTCRSPKREISRTTSSGLGLRMKRCWRQKIRYLTLPESNYGPLALSAELQWSC